MKKLILILTLFISTMSFGQSNPLLLFGDLQGNLRDVTGLWFNTLDNKALNVLGGKFTLTQTGAQVQIILDGAFAELTLDEYLYHAEDPNTHIRFVADQILFTTGSVTMLSLSEAAQDIVIINDAGADVDFRVESNNADSAFFVQGSDGKVFMEALTQQAAGGLVLEYTAATGEIYAETSTEKMKSNIQDANINSEDLLALGLKSYTDNQTGRKETGYIAEDMAEVMPELVVYKGNEPLGIKYTKMTMMLLDLIKKQQAQIDALEKRVVALGK